MIVSLCIPCGNRLHDLKRTMPYTVEAANSSPPIEIMILDYCSTDGLLEWLDQVKEDIGLSPANQFRFKRYSGRSSFHKAHAFNLSILSSVGEYFVLMGADAYPEPGYVPEVRNLIAQDCIWMHAKDLCGIIACQRKEFVMAGGYDERFSLYGPEDRELDERLQRRGGKFGLVPKGLMHVIRTPDEEKISNFGLKASKGQMSRMMRPILEESRANSSLVANPGGWGQWT